MVDWVGGVFAGCIPRVQLFVSTCNGRPQLALQHHCYCLSSINCHLDDCKARLVRFACKTNYIRIRGFLQHTYDSELDRYNLRNKKLS